jgi:hypothetical protein
VGIADLGGDLRLPEEGGALPSEPFPEDGLARSAAISVRRVEAAKAISSGTVEELERFFLAVSGAAQLWSGADAAEIAAAEPDALDVVPTEQ